ncbi:hypothetical protein RRG08_059937 [Elysia crispata]|uniref:Uncharacterized protein n=1 Tax=Elysia crispata TaxID=231223 RepID=A0AAE0Y6L2_9GAST|nr:hypothetical protein RRG08_059937 [Elysia crispata]
MKPVVIGPLLHSGTVTSPVLSKGVVYNGSARRRFSPADNIIQIALQVLCPQMSVLPQDSIARSGVSSGRVEHPGARDRASHDVAETRLLRRSWPSPSWSHSQGRRRMLISR